MHDSSTAKTAPDLAPDLDWHIAKCHNMANYLNDTAARLEYRHLAKLSLRAHRLAIKWRQREISLRQSQMILEGMEREAGGK